MSDVHSLPPPQELSAPMRPGSPADGGRQFLLVREGALACALPLAGVGETMRPQPIRPMGGAPPYVLGVSVIRGQIVPVVRLGALLSMDSLPPPGRFVLLQVDHRQVALAVESVPRVLRFDAPAAQTVPPLLRDVQPELIADIGRLDRDLLLVLQSSRLLPEDVWTALAAQSAGSSG